MPSEDNLFAKLLRSERAERDKRRAQQLNARIYAAKMQRHAEEERADQAKQGEQA